MIEKVQNITNHAEINRNVILRIPTKTSDHTMPENKNELYLSHYAIVLRVHTLSRFDLDSSQMFYFSQLIG